MSEYIYEQRQMDAWHEYQSFGGQVDFETFYARHVRVNEWIVNHMASRLFGANSPLSFNDFADSHTNPNGGI